MKGQDFTESGSAKQLIRNDPKYASKTFIKKKNLVVSNLFKNLQFYSELRI